MGEENNFSSLAGYSTPYVRPQTPAWMQLKPVAQMSPDPALAGGGQSYTWFDQQPAPATNLGVNTAITPYGASTVSPAALNSASMGTTPAGPVTQWMRDQGIIGMTDKNGIQQQGWGGLALGGAQALGSLYLGMQQYNLAKDTLANNKAQFERNFAAQKTTTNANLEDRQRARVASNAGAYQSVGDYMAQNGVR
jgi:hypothetical protein